MANGTTQTISTLIERQLPEFVRQNGPMFITFMEQYYAYMEQANTTVLASGKVIDRAKGLLDNADIDTAIDGFAQKLYGEFLTYFPQDAQINKDFILKNIKDFYRGRGSEQSYRFLFRALYGKESSIYLPKNDILIVSNGKWLIEKSLKVTNIMVNGVLNNTAQGALFFVNTLVKGNTSTATAAVERTTTAFVNNALVFELFVSGVLGVFTSGEQITTTDYLGNVISATLYSGQVTSVTITKGGTSYNIGDPVIFSNPPGVNPPATGFVSNVSSGNVATIVTTYGGAGFQVNNNLSITSTGSGSGATGHVLAVDTTGTQNCGPSTINVVFSLLGDLNSIALNANSYNITGAILGWTNANTSLANSLFFVTISNVGPILTVSTDNQGAGYKSPPSVAAVANVRITNLGAIGRMKINAPGAGYRVGDWLQFTNVVGGLGYGANAIVLANSATGGISQVQLCQFDIKSDQFIGGSGYDAAHLPSITIISSNGSASGANITVADLLGTDATFNVQTGSIGAIQKIQITSGGTNYALAPTINLMGYGDGTAQAYCNIITGAFTYPGRYTDDSSTISTHSFIEDRDYYQNFAYDIRVQQSIGDYRLPVKNMVHPAGMKMWGSYLYGGAYANTVNLSITSADVTKRTDQHFYIANAITFGANSYMNTSTAVTTSNSTKQGTFSMWLNFNTMPPAGTQSLVQIGNLFINIVNTAIANTYSTYFQILGSNTSTVLMDIRSNVRDVVVANTWVNLLASWDLTIPTANIYLTNVASLNVITLLGSNVFFNIANASVGYNNTNESWAEIWFNNTWINLANSNNRILFTTPYLQPANLANNGSNPTGAAPLIYFNNDYTAANNNDGTGGNFTVQGTLLNANSSPTNI